MDELSRRFAETLERLEGQYAEREAALESYVLSVEERLSRALNALSSQVEAQASFSQQLSAQLMSLSRDLGGLLASLDRSSGSPGRP